MGVEIRWDEAVDLTTELLTDPSSRAACAVLGLAAPWTHEAHLIADLFDVVCQANFKDPKPHPRPEMARKPARTPEESAARRRSLKARGH